MNWLNVLILRNYCYFGVCDDDFIVGLEMGSYYILEIDILKFWLRKENLEFASKLLGIIMVVVGAA